MSHGRASSSCGEDGLALREAFHVTAEGLHVDQLGNVEAVAVVDAARRVADRDDLRSSLVQQAARRWSRHCQSPAPTTVAPFSGMCEMLARALDGVEDAAAGGFVAAQRSAQADGLARDHAGNGIALGHAVGVHDPGHGLRVGVDVGRGNVLLRPDERQNRAGVAARHPFQLALRHLFGIAGDAAFGAAEGNVHHRALPRHPRGQRLHFVERDLRDGSGCRPWPARAPSCAARGSPRSGECGRRPCAPARSPSTCARDT